jgi:hypothetical protein
VSKITSGMNFEGWQKAWIALCVERGHVLRLDRWGDPDLFALNGGNCNGPACEKCGWNACMHCNWKGDKIPECKP